MAKPIIQYVERFGGGCGLKTGSRRQIEREMGTDNVRLIRNATEEDVSWVRAMGGYVPDGRIVKEPSDSPKTP